MAAGGFPSPGWDAGLDAPVRRYFRHALGDGAPIGARVTLRMTGRIRVGIWLPFTAEEEIDGRSFTWRARVGLGPLTLLRVVDRFADGEGGLEIRLLGRLRVARSTGHDVARSAAGRTALEAVAWAPNCVLPGEGVAWRAEADDHLVAYLDLPPERTEVHVRIDERGAVRAVSALRWGRPAGRAFAEIPFGADALAEARFGRLTLPSRLTVAWWYGTSRAARFFDATVLGATAGPAASRPPARGRGVAEALAGVGVMARALLRPDRRTARCRWGLDPAAASRRLPGDDLVPAPRWQWTHGVEVDAPAQDVWPWIAQVGADRGGFYSYEWLENLVGCRLRNADAVHPEWELRRGDPLILHPRQPAPLVVVEVDRGRHLVAHVGADPAAQGAGRSWFAASWLFLVEPLGPGRSRVISRYRSDFSDRAATRLALGPTLLEPIGYAMDRRMLEGIRERAEALS